MARRKTKSKANSGEASFRYEWVSWSPKQLDELRGWLEGNDDTLEASIQRICDEGWKVSTSENQRTGRYLVSITDKWDRKGCSNISWGIEHSSLVSAILGAVYYATEVIGDGTEGDTPISDLDLW